MKKFKQLKINNLSKAEMKRRELNVLKAGGGIVCVGPLCSCPCAYAGPQSDPTDSYYGGSSFDANGNANVGTPNDNN